MAAANNKIFARPDPSSDWLTVRVGKRAATRAAAKRLQPLVSPEQTYQMVGRDKKAQRKATLKGNEPDTAESNGSKSKKTKEAKKRDEQQKAFDACAGLSYLGRHVNCFPTPLNHMKLLLRENRVTCVRCHECKASKPPVQCCPYLLYRKPQIQQIPRSKLSPAIRTGPQWQFIQSPRQESLRHNILPHFCHFVSKARVHKRRHHDGTESTRSSVVEPVRTSQAAVASQQDQKQQRRRTDGEVTALHRVSLAKIEVQSLSGEPVVEHFEDVVLRQLTDEVHLPGDEEEEEEPIPIAIGLQKSRTRVRVDVDDIPIAEAVTSEEGADLQVKYESISISPEQVDSRSGQIVVDKTASEIEDERPAGHTSSGHLIIRTQASTDRRRSMHERPAYETSERERHASDAEEMMRAKAAEASPSDGRAADIEGMSRSKQSITGVDMASESYVDAMAKADDDDARQDEGDVRLETDVGEGDVTIGDAGDIDATMADVDEPTGGVEDITAPTADVGDTDAPTGDVVDLGVPTGDVGDVDISAADIEDAGETTGDAPADDVEDADALKGDIVDIGAAGGGVGDSDVYKTDAGDSEIHPAGIGEGDLTTTDIIEGGDAYKTEEEEVDDQVEAGDIAANEADKEDVHYGIGAEIEPVVEADEVVASTADENIVIDIAESGEIAPIEEQIAVASDNELDNNVTSIEQENAEERNAEAIDGADAELVTNAGDAEAVDERAEITEIIEDQAIMEVEHTEQDATAVDKTGSIDQIGAVDRMESTHVADVEASPKSTIGKSESMEAVETAGGDDAKKLPRVDNEDQIYAEQTAEEMYKVSDNALNSESEAFYQMKSEVLDIINEPTGDDNKEDEEKSNDGLSAFEQDASGSEYDIENDA